MREHKYSYGEMIARLMKKAVPIRGYLIISTLASIIGNLSRMGLMGFGSLWILCAFGTAAGNTVVYAVCTILSGALIAICRYLEGVYSHKGAYGILASMRTDLYAEIDRLSPAYLIDHKMGDIISTAVSDIEQLEFFFAHMIGPMFTVILLPVISVIFAWHYNVLFAVILIPVYILVSVVIPLIALRAGKRAGMLSRKSQAALRSSILESVYGMKDIQIYDAGKAKTDEMLSRNEEVNRSSHMLKIHRSILSSVPDFFTYAVRILVIALGGYLAARGTGSPVGTIVVSFVASASFSSTFSLTTVVTNLLETFAGAERIFAIEDAVPAVTEASAGIDPGPIRKVEFDDVTFAYPGTKEKILDHVSFSIRGGERIGLIGESGTGKSTVLRLLMRFYDPDGGQIRINDIPLEKISFSALHRHIAVLEQDTYLFDATIADNIEIGKAGASGDEIQKAARRAGIDTFIDTLPDGYDTQMGTMNARLSGGERQRIGLSRILLKDPDMIVLDEPTSALDVLHEKELLKTLHEQSADRTVLIISHRMSTLSGCSKILEMKGGSMKESVYCS